MKVSSHQEKTCSKLVENVKIIELVTLQINKLFWKRIRKASLQQDHNHLLTVLQQKQMDVLNTTTQFTFQKEKSLSKNIHKKISIQINCDGIA